MTADAEGAVKRDAHRAEPPRGRWAGGSDGWLAPWNDRCQGRLAAHRPKRVSHPCARCEHEPMETWTAINTIRVIREFADRPLETADLDRILNAGRRTASSKNGRTGRSSSFVTGRISASWPKSGDMPTTSRAPPWRSRSSAPRRRTSTSSRRTSGISDARRRTWCSPRGSSGSGACRRRSTTSISRDAFSVSPTIGGATSFSRSAIRRTLRSSPRRTVREAAWRYEEIVRQERW